jgi:prepilin-type N-terminal cleavage/methylation domain-containing protein
MNRSIKSESGFTLIEIAIVLLIVTILLGYTVALFPRQQELKQFRAADQEMDEIINAIIGFAQVNGRLPCPAIPASIGLEDEGGANECGNFGGFVPVNTLGINGRLNRDSLMMDPWGNPYRYYVTASDYGGIDGSDFVMNGDMQTIGLVDVIDVENDDLTGDDYIDLDGQFLICDSAGSSMDDVCTGAITVFGKDAGIIDMRGPYAGAPFVLISHGKNWNQAAAAGDELENMGGTLTTALPTPMPNGPRAFPYLLKNVAAGETTFVKRTTGFAEDFDDIVKWVSPNILFSKMIDAGQLP